MKQFRVLGAETKRRSRSFEIYSIEACNSKTETEIEKMEGGDGEGIDRVVDSKDLQQQSKALDKLTDRVEDRQLDSTRVQEAMASISASAEADANAMRLRYRSLSRFFFKDILLINGIIKRFCLRVEHLSS